MEARVRADVTMTLIFSPLRLALFNSGALVLTAQPKKNRGKVSDSSTERIDRQSQHDIVKRVYNNPGLQLCTCISLADGRFSSVVFFDNWPNFQLCNAFLYQISTFILCVLACVFYLCTSLLSILVRMIFLSFLRIQLKTNLLLLSIEASSFNFQIINQMLIFVYRLTLTSFVASAVLLVLVIM